MVPVEGFRLLLEAEGGFEAGASDCKKLEAILRILLASPKYSKRGLETVLKNIDSIPSVILKRNIDELGRDPAVLKNFEVAQFLCDVVGRETGNRVSFLMTSPVWTHLTHIFTPG